MKRLCRSPPLSELMWEDNWTGVNQKDETLGKVKTPNGCDIMVMG